MCGIIGFIGEKPALSKVMIGLERLEPRGYDSFGLAILNPDETSTLVKKAYLSGEGGFADFKNGVPEDISGTIGIGHTRWATHGNVTDVNAHPHFCSREDVFIVHNGMIENYKDLISKYELQKILVSKTDSEVIAHIISHHMQYGKTFREAFDLTINELRGSFGIAAICKQEPNKILAAKLGSDLYIGKARNGYFVASAKSAYHGAAENGFALLDGQMCELTKNSSSVWNLKGEKQVPKLEKTESDYEKVDLDGYEHVMMKEIMQASKVVRDSSRGRIYKDENQQFQVRLGGLESVADKLHEVQRVVIVGCGTAYHAALFAKMMFEKYVRIPTNAYTATEFVDNDFLVEQGTLFIAISQSGTTKDTIDAVKKANRLNMMTLGIVNTVGSEIARITDAGVHNHAGPEYAVASTKALTSQLVVIGLITVFLGDRKTMLTEDKQAILGEIDRLPEVLQDQLENDAYNVSGFVYSSFKHGAIIGSNVQPWIAFEAALKIREISYCDFFGFPASELKHGNIALVDSEYLVISIEMKDTSLQKVHSNAIQVASRDGNVVVVSSNKQEDFPTILYPKGITVFESLLVNLQMQRFAYHFAKNNGCPIDRPRNLAKTVTVE